MAGVIEGAVVNVVFEPLLKNLVNVLTVNCQYVLEYERQFKDMKKQLALMQGFVTNTEKLKENLEIVRPILDTLREILYEADDLVIDCLIYSDNRSSWACISPGDLRFRRQTGKKLTSINGRITEGLETFRKYISPMERQPNNDGICNRPSRWTSELIDSEIVGLDKDAETIKHWICSQSEEPHRIGIVGMGGVGKTTLTRKIFNDKRVQAHFKPKIWLSITETFSEIGIMKSILLKLEKDDSGSEDILQTRICQALSDTRYLIVLDDVWNVKNGWWKNISRGLPKNPNSCIIITSRNENVVKEMEVAQARIHLHKTLEEKDSLLLFWKVAFKSTKGTCKDGRKEMGETIVKKCKGLPLAIKTVGGLLSSKDLLSEWKEIRDKFSEKIAIASDGDVMVSLQLSYDELSLHLKHCFLSFSVYPEDYEISTDQLARWWVGEGFVDETGNAFSYLTDLISRCLVEVVEKRKYDGRVYICKVHDLVRELAIKIARQETFCSFNERSVQIPTAESRRLGITREMKNFSDMIGNSKLRALLLMTNHSIPFKKGNPLAKVNTLRVLDLSHLKLDDVCVKDLWNWICSLKRLRYLNLQGVTELDSVHKSIGKLWGLQTLILAGCTKLSKLPTSIGNLCRLKVLDVGNCKKLSFLPQLSKLVELEELYGFIIASSSDREECQFRELSHMTKLRVLQVDIKKDSIIKEEDLLVLQHHDNLKILTIDANNLEDEELLAKIDQLSPPKNLAEVYLKGYNGHSIPKWVSPTSLPNVEYLCLEDFKSANVVNPEFLDDANTKWNLQGLCTKYLINLPIKWETLKSAMPLLNYLEVGHCYKFQDFECDVNGFDTWRQKKVEKPEVTDCPEEENMPKEEEKPEVNHCKDEEDYTVQMDI